jgi:PAS domain S-box-containing protein
LWALSRPRPKTATPRELSLVDESDSWQKRLVTLPSKPARLTAAPALFRLLSDSALSRAALSACGLPVAMFDAVDGKHSITYVNPAFESFFGFNETDALGRPLAALLFRGEQAILHSLLHTAAAPRELKIWGKDGNTRHVEVRLGAIRSVEGHQTHWVIAFSDRAELERLRAELQALKATAKAA